MTATGSRGARPNEDTARLWDLARGRVHRLRGTRTEQERWAQEVGSPHLLHGNPPWKLTLCIRHQLLGCRLGCALHPARAAATRWHPHEGWPQAAFTQTNCSLVTCKSSPAYEPDLQTLQIEQLEQAVPKHCSSFNSP